VAGDKLTYFFEIDAKTPGLDDLISKLEKSGSKLREGESELQKLQKQLSALKAPGEIKRLQDEIANFGKPAKRGFEGIGHAVEEAKSSFRSLLEFTGGMVLFEGLEKGIELLKELGVEAISAAAKAERLDLSFELTVGQEGAKDVLDWVDKITGKTEFTDDALKGWALQLANAGLKGEQLKDTLAAALDVAGKRGPQAMGMAIDALERATLSGKIEGRALRGLGIPVADLAQLNQFKGLNEKQINKKLETTSVSKEDLLSLIAGPDNLLGDKGVRAAGTLEAKLTHLKDLPDQFFQKLKDTSAFAALTTKADEFLSKLDPESPAGQKIFGALEDVFSTITGAIDGIDMEAVATTISEDIIPAMEVFKDVAKATLGAFEGIAKVFEFLGGSKKAKDIPRSSEEIKLDALYEKQKVQLREVREAKAAGKANPYALPEGASETGIKRLKDAADSTDKATIQHEAARDSFRDSFASHIPVLGGLIDDALAGPAAPGQGDNGKPLVPSSPTLPAPQSATMSRPYTPIHFGDISVTVSGDADPDETGRATAESIRTHLTRALEGVGMESGSR
jgi:hypothetical protein